jgi:heme/copper-type cytochrome/quinol oxidase subunit 1
MGIYMKSSQEKIFWYTGIALLVAAALLYTNNRSTSILLHDPYYIFEPYPFFLAGAFILFILGWSYRIGLTRILPPNISKSYAWLTALCLIVFLLCLILYAKDDGMPRRYYEVIPSNNDLKSHYLRQGIGIAMLASIIIGIAVQLMIAFYIIKALIKSR